MWRRNKTVFILTIISFAGNTAVIFGYFFPLEPLGASIYFIWLTLGHILAWLGFPGVADISSWVRKLQDQTRRLRNS